MRPSSARWCSDRGQGATAGREIEGIAIFSQQIVNGLMLGSIYAMVAVALTLSIGVLRFLNFSIPGLFMIGGMVTWALVRGGTPWPLAAGAALIAGALASLVVERFTWRWMRSAQHFVPLVSSMAFLLLFEHLAVIYWGSELRTLPALFGTSDWRVAGLVISLPQLAGLLCSIALIWALTLVLARTRLGRGLRTIAEDSDTALLLGVDINRIVPLVFLISGLFAALAGVIFALNYRQVHPFMGEVVGLKGISAMIVGGMGNVWGSIAGGLIIGLVEVMSIGYFGADFVDIAVYGLLLLILFIRPTGLFAGAIAAHERISRRRSGSTRGECSVRLWRLPAACGRTTQSGAGRLRGDRRLCFGIPQQCVQAFTAYRHPVCRRRGRRGGAHRGGAGTAHPRHLSGACYVCARPNRASDHSQSRSGRRRRRLPGRGVYSASDHCRGSGHRRGAGLAAVRNALRNRGDRGSR